MADTPPNDQGRRQVTFTIPSNGPPPRIRVTTRRNNPLEVRYSNGAGRGTVHLVPTGNNRHNGAVRVNGGRRPARISGSGTRSNSPLPQLRELPLPEQQQKLRSEQEDATSLDGHHYNCPICLADVMRQPASFGCCSKRFCYECLTRLVDSSTNAPPKCPNCRTEFRPGDEDTPQIQLDSELMQEIDEIPPVPCRYQECNQVLKISEISSHEETCDCVVVKCRFSSFGCNWSGPRVQLQAHFDDDCGHYPLASLIQQHREAVHNYTSTIANQENALVGIRAMLHTQERQLQRLQAQAGSDSKSPENILDLLSYVYTVTCCTTQFIRNRRAWENMYVP